MSAENPDFLRDTRTAYDTIAYDFDKQFPAEGLAGLVLERALFGAFAEWVGANRASGRSAAPVADLGSGPGHITARLDALGLPVFGVDVSPRMVELARRAYPELRFHVGSMTSLDLPASTLGGIVALYSIIHVPDDQLPATFAEFERVLVPGGYVLLAFQAGREEGNTEHLHLDERFGHEISLDYYWRDPDTVADLLKQAGLRPHTQVVREPQEGEVRPRAFLVARKDTA
ncbi:class I SAM-dependent methyltransferase [Streptomyces sp. S.PB5]|uniref:class I SAM-dependent methyltransferase n=1 Tax=Streptomyces sp. S.PB5 TaxID=3020844 RepID=UPI0025B0440A|nr:class I SAM-dependent methyltransferase [Streptomyces sp. S.PB5]MDN3024427.1 class I SAM-dependent methyltransferase [Streptomyces sp. S.PB5]